MVPDNYTVAFGREAWTLSYTDALGSCTLTLDCDLESLEQPTGVKQRLILNPGVSQAVLTEGEELIEGARAQLVMARVKAYLESIGYEVEVYRL